MECIKESIKQKRTNKGGKVEKGRKLLICKQEQSYLGGRKVPVYTPKSHKLRNYSIPNGL